MPTGREICTKERPYNAATADPSLYWAHPSADCTYSGDDYDRYECPICGTSFRVYVGK
jgi:hypothetical protein